MLSKLLEFVNPVKLPQALFNGVKKYQSDIILVIGVILISFLSFAAGYIAAKDSQKPPIIFQETQNGE